MSRALNVSGLPRLEAIKSTGRAEQKGAEAHQSS